MRITPDNAQHIGAREKQEDSFGFSAFDNEELIQTRGCLAVITDGMGGMSLGQQASNIAVQSFLSRYQDLSQIDLDINNIPHHLEESLLFANQMVCKFAKEKGLLNQVGTTLIAAAIKGTFLHWISVGDSRIYLFRNKKLTKLTEDHILANHLLEEVAQGILSKKEAESHPQKDALTSFLGIDDLCEIDKNLKPFPLIPGDRILLCSDGLYGFITEQEMEATFTTYEDNVCQALMNKVITQNNPYQDNVTIAILQYDHEIVEISNKMGEAESKSKEIVMKQNNVDLDSRLPKSSKKRSKNILSIVLTLFISIILLFGGYYGYEYVFKTNKYRELINVDWIPFLNKNDTNQNPNLMDNESKENEEVEENEEKNESEEDKEKENEERVSRRIITRRIKVMDKDEKLPTNF